MPKTPPRMYRIPRPLALALWLGASGVAAASAPAASTVDADTYRAEMSAAGPYKIGAGSVRVSLTAKQQFHINGEYPYRFKASPPAEGVSYPKPVLERADGQFAEKTAVFNLPFVASHAGQFAVGGVLNLSVCSASSCIVHKAPLNVTVTVQ